MKAQILIYSETVRGVCLVQSHPMNKSRTPAIPDLQLTSDQMCLNFLSKFVPKSEGFFGLYGKYVPDAAQIATDESKFLDLGVCQSLSLNRDIMRMCTHFLRAPEPH